MIAGPQVILLRNAAGHGTMLRSAVPRRGQAQQAPAAGSAARRTLPIFRQETHPDDGSIIIGSTNSQNRSTTIT